MYVSENKKNEVKKGLCEKCGCLIGCAKCFNKLSFIDKLADANIPSAYWFLRLSDFKGSPIIKSTVNTYVNNIKNNYNDGKSLCLAGTLGTGKTYSSCCILKIALMKNYSVYYTTLSDLVFYVTDNELKKEFYSKLIKSDFLCIDEVDSRHFSDTETSADFFGRTFEKIFRYRLQNNLPIIMATNNASIDEAFAGQFKKVMNSLTNFSTVIAPALGVDFRVKNKKGL